MIHCANVKIVTIAPISLVFSQTNMSGVFGQLFWDVAQGNGRQEISLEIRRVHFESGVAGESKVVRAPFTQEAQQVHTAASPPLFRSACVNFTTVSHVPFVASSQNTPGDFLAKKLYFSTTKQRPQEEENAKKKKTTQSHCQKQEELERLQQKICSSWDK